MMLDGKAVAMPLKEERAEIDTTLPFESVRAAVSLFGEQIEPKTSKLHERRVTQCAELRSTQEELLKTRERLAITEKEKENALMELADARKLLEHSAKSKPITSERSGAIVKGKRIEPIATGTEDKYASWETRLQVINEKHVAAVADIESARQELTVLKQELLASLTKKDAIFYQTETHLDVIDDMLKTGDDITAEVVGLNNWLTILKLVSSEVSKEKTGHNGSEGCEMGKEFECKLIAMMNESLRIKGEMKAVKDGEAKLLNMATEILANLEASSTITERTGLAEEIPNLTEAKRSKQNRASLPSIMDLLHIESETLKRGVIGLMEREAKALAAANASKAELSNIRTEMTAAIAAVEAKAMESMTALSKALERAEAEAAEAKAKTEELQEAASRARTDAEQAKRDLQKIEDKYTELAAKAVRSTENKPIEQPETAAENTLQHTADKVHIAEVNEVDQSSLLLQQSVSKVDGGNIIISQDDYEALKKKAQEAEELASHRAASAIDQVEAVREMLLQKIASANEDMEHIKVALKQALHKAEMAEKAKEAMTTELKRLREREHRQREKAMVMASQQQQEAVGQSSSFSQAHHEPLGNVLNIKFATERTKTLVRISSRKHKKLSSYLTKKS